MKRRKLLTALFLLLAVCALALGIAAVRRAQRLPSRAGVRVPVLMYHAVGDDCWGEESLFVKPEELEKQLQYLSENGYETIFFEDLSHIEQYEKEIIELKEKGLTKREIGERFGISKDQVKGVLQRKRRREEKLSCGVLLKKRGRPAKDSVVTEENKLAELRYKLARKDARIKQLEMENELMRDFLSLTERK